MTARDAFVLLLLVLVSLKIALWLVKKRERTYAYASLALCKCGAKFGSHGKAEKVVEQPTESKPRPVFHGRLEDSIELRHCGQVMQLAGNLSLRGSAGAKTTRLAYECQKCFQRLQVVDEWDQPDITAIDSTP